MEPRREISVGNFGTCHCEGGDKIMAEGGKRGGRDTKDNTMKGEEQKGKKKRANDWTHMICYNYPLVWVNCYGYGSHMVSK